MKLGRVRFRVATGADVTDYVAARDSHPFAERGGVSIEMRVVVTVAARIIEFVDRDSALHAQE
jgi:hypothetical protein